MLSSIDNNLQYFTLLYMQKYELVCQCGSILLKYRKNRDEISRYCYLNQICDTECLKKFQSDLTSNDPEKVRVLICTTCHRLIGKPILHNGQLAFLLRQNFFQEKRISI